MKSRHMLLMVALVGFAGFVVGCAGTPSEPTSPPPMNKTDSAAVDAAGNSADAVTPSALDNVRDTFKDVTNAALTDNGLDSLAGQLANADQERMKSYVSDKDNLADLNEVVGRIRRDWKNKYGNDFKLGNADKILRAVKLSDMTTDDGINEVVATLPKDDRLPEVKLNLIRESGSWKIDLPDSATGAMLKASLIKRLEMVEKMKDRWPTDQNQAYQLVARHVLQGVSEAGRG